MVMQRAVKLIAQRRDPLKSPKEAHQWHHNSSCLPEPCPTEHQPSGQ